jgi:hypothetical protein
MAKKIKKEELEKLQGIVNKLNQIQSQLGLIEMQKHELLHAVVEVQNDLKNNRAELEKEYGNISINIADGTITEKDKENASDKKD